MLLEWADRLRHRARLKSGNPAHAWGKRGEDLAHRLLQRKGYTVVARNYRTRSGNAEVDLIARDGETVVFVEVKARATNAFGTPDEAVDAEKRRRILRAAAEYLHRSETPWANARFEIVTVLFGNGELVEHLTDAFAAPQQL